MTADVQQPTSSPSCTATSWAPMTAFACCARARRAPWQRPPRPRRLLLLRSAAPRSCTWNIERQCGQPYVVDLGPARSGPPLAGTQLTAAGRPPPREPGTPPPAPAAAPASGCQALRAGWRAATETPWPAQRQAAVFRSRPPPPLRSDCR